MVYGSVYTLAGIGDANGRRLNNAGYYEAQQIYDVFERLNFDAGRCKTWLINTCNAYSNHADACYFNLKRYYDEERQKEKQSRCSSSNSFHGYESSQKPMYQSPQRLSYSPVHQSPASSSKSYSSDSISRTEIMEMMAEFKKKQDIMAIQIIALEREKTESKDYIKLLEGKLEKATELQKRQEAKIADLTNKLRDIDRTEQCDTTSNTVDTLNRKCEEMNSELKHVKQRSTLHSYIKALERKIQEIENNATAMQKQQNEKNMALMKKISDFNIVTERYDELTTSIDIITKKIEDVMKQQNEVKKQQYTSNAVILKRLEKDILNMTIELNKISTQTVRPKEASSLQHDKKSVTSVTNCSVKKKNNELNKEYNSSKSPSLVTAS